MGELAHELSQAHSTGCKVGAAQSNGQRMRPTRSSAVGQTYRWTAVTGSVAFVPGRANNASRRRGAVPSSNGRGTLVGRSA